MLLGYLGEITITVFILKSNSTPVVVWDPSWSQEPEIRITDSKMVWSPGRLLMVLSIYWGNTLLCTLRIHSLHPSSLWSSRSPVFAPLLTSISWWSACGTRLLPLPRYCLHLYYRRYLLFTVFFRISEVALIWKSHSSSSLPSLIVFNAITVLLQTPRVMPPKRSVSWLAFQLLMNYFQPSNARCSRILLFSLSKCTELQWNSFILLAFHIYYCPFDLPCK